MIQVVTYLEQSEPIVDLILGKTKRSGDFGLWSDREVMLSPSSPYKRSFS